MKCGYCWLAESGRVADASQIAPYRRTEHIDQLAAFFNSRTTPQEAWTLLLTGGEPLLMPNLGRLCGDLFRHGNRVAFYSSLFVDENQANFQFLRDCNPSDVDYVMALFHPEAEANEDAWFRKVEMLKRTGHKVFIRFVGHPDRLHRLEELSRKCQDLDVAFYAASLLSNRYPAAYSGEQRERLSSHFASTSQFIQLLGGIDTRSTRCLAGSKLIAVDLRTGNITPCISVSSAVIEGASPVRIETPADRWAYAAQFPLRTPSALGGRTFVVRLEYTIERGKLGIGCVTGDGRAFVGEGEKIAVEGDSQSDITIDLEDGAGWLVIRNVSADGEPSVLQLLGIRTFAAEPANAIRV